MARRRRSPAARVALYGLNVLVIMFLVLPLVAVVFGSVQTERALLSDVLSPWPKEVTLSNFQILLSGGQQGERVFEQANYFPATLRVFPRAFMNSVVVAVGVTVATLAFGSLAAYAVCRLRFRWTRAFMYANLASRMVPIIVLMVPLYVTLRWLGLLNSLSGIVVTEVGLLLPYAVWILSAYFAALPAELEDAARIDGCSRLGVLGRVVLPLAAPGIVTAFIFGFTNSWNEFLFAVVMAQRTELRTIPAGLYSFQVGDVLLWGQLMAAALIATLPVVLLFMLVQRFVVQGLTVGAVKG